MMTHDKKAVPSVSVTYARTGASTKSNAFGMREAHERNDEVLERIYFGRRFKNDTERLEKLFELYTKLTSARVA